MIHTKNKVRLDARARGYYFKGNSNMREGNRGLNSVTDARDSQAKPPRSLPRDRVGPSCP